MGEFDVIKSIEENAKAEAEAIKGYVELLATLEESEVEEKDKESIISALNEIIADELNHQEILHKLFQDLTGIKAKEN